MAWSALCVRLWHPRGLLLPGVMCRRGCVSQPSAAGRQQEAGHRRVRTARRGVRQGEPGFMPAGPWFPGRDGPGHGRPSLLAHAVASAAVRSPAAGRVRRGEACAWAPAAIRATLLSVGQRGEGAAPTGLPASWAPRSAHIGVPPTGRRAGGSRSRRTLQGTVPALGPSFCVVKGGRSVAGDPAPDARPTASPARPAARKHIISVRCHTKQQLPSSEGC